MFRMTSVLGLTVIGLVMVNSYKPREDKTKCPRVKALRNIDLHEEASGSEPNLYAMGFLPPPIASAKKGFHTKLMGVWYVVEYYASSEEMPEYSCMKARFTVSPENLDVSMKFNYSFVDDPNSEKLSGNITWQIPDLNQPAHWIHAEDTYEGVYNTYVLDSDYRAFGLLLHCAEKSGSTRYLSSLILSRNETLKTNVVNYLKEKLPRYDIDLKYMFPVAQKKCQERVQAKPQFGRTRNKNGNKHPLKQGNRG